MDQINSKPGSNPASGASASPPRPFAKPQRNTVFTFGSTKRQRLLRWICRSMRTTPEAWARTWPDDGFAYEHLKNGVRVAMKNFKPAIVKCNGELFNPGLYWRFRLRFAMTRIAVRRIHKIVFGYCLLLVLLGLGGLTGCEPATRSTAFNPQRQIDNAANVVELGKGFKLIKVQTVDAFSPDGPYQGGIAPSFFLYHHDEGAGRESLVQIHVDGFYHGESRYASAWPSSARPLCPCDIPPCPPCADCNCPPLQPPLPSHGTVIEAGPSTKPSKVVEVPPPPPLELYPPNPPKIDLPPLPDLEPFQPQAPGHTLRIVPIPADLQEKIHKELERLREEEDRKNRETKLDIPSVPESRPASQPASQPVAEGLLGDFPELPADMCRAPRLVGKHAAAGAIAIPSEVHGKFSYAFERDDDARYGWMDGVWRESDDCWEYTAPAWRYTIHKETGEITPYYGHRTKGLVAAGLKLGKLRLDGSDPIPPNVDMEPVQADDSDE